MILVADLEADGLLDTATTVHVLCLSELNGEVCTYHNAPALDRAGTLEEGIERLNTASTIVFHNGTNYDIPLLGKLHGVDVEAWQSKLHDTYMLSQLFFANEMKVHNLAAWGGVFKVPKPKHEDWTKLTEDMIHRCEQDVEITKELYKRCVPLLPGSEKALQLEQNVLKIFGEQQFGVHLNIPKAHALKGRLSQIVSLIEHKIQAILPLRYYKEGEPYARISTKSGELTAAVKRWAMAHNINPAAIAGPFTRVAVDRYNLNSPKQLVQYLLDEGWEPEEYNYQKDKTGRLVKVFGKPVPISPKTAGSSFIGVKPPLGQLLAKRGQVIHKLRQVEGWLNNADENGLVPTAAYTCGTNTARFRHMIVANVPKASPDVFAGRRMRACLEPRDGYVFVGCDASQLEARIQGHYTAPFDGGEYADFLLNQDIHAFNAKLFGTSRHNAKAPGYALDYGCGPGKLVKLLGCSVDEAKVYWNNYWDARPASKQLREKLEQAVESRGFKKGSDIYYKRAWIKGLDGRRIYVRSWHSLVNSLVQSAGSICMKKAYIDLAKRLPEGARIAIFYHDEFQIECLPEDAELVAQLAESAIEEAGKSFGLRIPLVGESKIGKSWKDTH